MAKKELKNVAIGLSKGFITTPVTTNNRKETRKQLRSRRITKRAALVRNVIRDVVGFAPFELRMIELIKAGDEKSYNKSAKIAKKRLGTHQRGQRKRDYIEAIVKAQRKK